MKNNTNKFLKGMASRFSATVMLLALGCVSAFASNKLYLRDGDNGTPNQFSIVPGQTKTLQVVLDNDDPVSYLEFKLACLNPGLSLNVYSVTKVPERITPSSHKIEVTKPSDYYQLGIISTSASMSGSAIKGNSGAILEIKIQATYNFIANKDNPDFRGVDASDIMIYDVMGCDATVFDAKALPMENSLIPVTPDVAKFSSDSEQLFIRPLGEGSIGVSMDNKIGITNIQCKVTLPEGLNFTEDCISFSDRVSENVQPGLNPVSGEPNTYILLIQSMTNDPILDNKGNIFSLNVSGNKDFADGDIVISDIIVASRYNVSYALGDVLKYGVKNVTDPSGDGVWDTDDVIAVTDAVLDGSENLVFDLNGDGVVDVLDYVSVIDKVLGE